LVSSSIAKHLGFPKTVARVKARDYFSYAELDFGRLFGVDYFIGAEVLAAQDLFTSAVHGQDIASAHFAHGAIQMRTIAIPPEWNFPAVPMRDLKLPSELIVGLIVRDGKPIIPRGDTSIEKGDEVTLIGEAKTMNRLNELFRLPQKKVRSVVLIGGTLIA